jgi:hypothetical protein
LLLRCHGGCFLSYSRRFVFAQVDGDFLPWLNWVCQRPRLEDAQSSI